MRPFCLWSIFAALVLDASAAQLSFDFSKTTPGQLPPGFVSLVTGEGKPANWSVAVQSVPPAIAPLLEKAQAPAAEQSVLTVQSPDVHPDHFPLLLFTNEMLSDFTLTTRFKISGGVIGPMAGVVLRARDASNYYIVRASTEGNLLWYRVVGGKSYESLGIGVRVPMPKDTWQELRVECSANKTRCFLNDKLVIPPVRPGAPTNDLAINDTTFASGRIGFWCKADTQCAFANTTIQYKQKVPFAEIVVSEVKKKYPRLLGLQIYANRDAELPVLVGDFNNLGLGSPGTKYEADVLERGSIYYLKSDKAVEVWLPLRDRNGDVAAALKTKMESFPGETRDTAIAKATVVKKVIERQMENFQGINE